MSIAGSKVAQVIAEMPTDSLVEAAVEIDKEGEIPSGDNLVLLQLEVADRIKQNQKE